jgi:hypothetical protein
MVTSARRSTHVRSSRPAVQIRAIIQSVGRAGCAAARRQPAPSPGRHQSSDCFRSLRLAGTRSPTSPDIAQSVPPVRRRPACSGQKDRPFPVAPGRRCVAGGWPGRCPGRLSWRWSSLAGRVTLNVKQPGFRAQKSIADDDAAMPGKERGRVALVPRSSTTPGASNFGWRADRAFECFMIRGGCLSWQ